MVGGFHQPTQSCWAVWSKEPSSSSSGAACEAATISSWSTPASNRLVAVQTGDIWNCASNSEWNWSRFFCMVFLKNGSCHPIYQNESCQKVLSYHSKHLKQKNKKKVSNLNWIQKMTNKKKPPKQQQKQRNAVGFDSRPWWRPPGLPPRRPWRPSSTRHRWGLPRGRSPACLGPSRVSGKWCNVHVWKMVHVLIVLNHVLIIRTFLKTAEEKMLKMF